MIGVAFFGDEAEVQANIGLADVTEADHYATTVREAAKIAVEMATGKRPPGTQSAHEKGRAGTAARAATSEGAHAEEVAVD